MNQAYKLRDQPAPIRDRQGSVFANVGGGPGTYTPVTPVPMNTSPATRMSLAPGVRPVNPSQVVSLAPGVRPVNPSQVVSLAPGVRPVNPSQVVSLAPGVTPVNPVYPSPSIPLTPLPPMTLPPASYPANIPIPLPPISLPPGSYNPIPPIPIQPIPNQPPAAYPSPGGAIIAPVRDSHGCLITGGQSWCPLTRSCVNTSETPCILGPTGEPRPWAGLEPPPPVFPHNPEAILTSSSDEICDFSSPFYCTARQEQAFAAAEVYGMGGVAGACVQPAAPYGESRCQIDTAGHCAATTNGVFEAGNLMCPAGTTFTLDSLASWISPEGGASVTHLLGR